MAGFSPALDRLEGAGWKSAEYVEELDPWSDDWLRLALATASSRTANCVVAPSVCSATGRQVMR